MPAIMGKDLRWLPAFSNGGEEKKVKKAQAHRQLLQNLFHWASITKCWINFVVDFQINLE